MFYELIVEICPALALDFGFDLSLTGVVILEIEQKSLSHRMRLKAGDIILKVNNKSIKTVKDIENIKLISTRSRTQRIRLLRNGKKINREFVIRPRWRRRSKM